MLSPEPAEAALPWGTKGQKGMVKNMYKGFLLSMVGKKKKKINETWCGWAPCLLPGGFCCAEEMGSI